MIALELGNIDEAEQHISTDIGRVSYDPLIRHRMFNLSLLARLGVAKKDAALVKASIGPLRAALTHAKAFRRNDYFVASLALATASVTSRTAGRAVVIEFSDSTRDAEAPPWREFAAILDP